jgi:hypothetical protein
MIYNWINNGLLKIDLVKFIIFLTNITKQLSKIFKFLDVLKKKYLIKVNNLFNKDSSL